MYLNVSHGRIKKPEVSKYLNEIKQYLAEKYATALPKINPNALYKLKIRFVLKYENFYTKTYPKNKAGTPLQRDDIDNRVKAIKDIICKFVGVKDDTQIIREEISKIAGNEEGMDIEITESVPTCYGHDTAELDRIYLNNCINFREKGIITNGNSTSS
jgi:Holliday junction resolvase RusA-like endonuclease